MAWSAVIGANHALDASAGALKCVLEGAAKCALMSLISSSELRSTYVEASVAHLAHLARVGLHHFATEAAAANNGLAWDDDGWLSADDDLNDSAVDAAMRLSSSAATIKPTAAAAVSRLHEMSTWCRTAATKRRRVAPSVARTYNPAAVAAFSLIGAGLCDEAEERGGRPL